MTEERMKRMVLDLCRPCLEARKARGERLRQVGGGADRKVICVDCGRRRFGAVYENGLTYRPAPPRVKDGAG